MPALQTILDLFRPGMRVFMAGSAGEPGVVLEALAADPERARGVEIVTSAVPGINGFDWARLHETTTVTGLFMQPAFGALQRSGRFRHLPISYAGFVAMIAADPRGFDLTVVQVARSEGDGGHSLGPAVEFMPAALARSRRVAAIVNERSPTLRGAPNVLPAGFDAMAEVDQALPTYDPGFPDPTSLTIAEHIAHFIPDGAVLQTGLGKVPAALAAALRDRRLLRLSGGMFSDGLQMLHDSGALDPHWPHAACVLVGRSALYDWAADQGWFKLVGCEQSHNPARLSAMAGFVAVNSAIEVDLFGQAALEHAGGAAVSGAGGAPDFARAAAFSQGGCSIVALPATGRGASVSRIVARLSAPGVIALPRADVGVVVTENGAADLRGLSVMERAQAIMSIADRSFVDQLQVEWSQITARL